MAIEYKNTHIETQEDFDNENDNLSFKKKVFIDAFPQNDKEGWVVAEVLITISNEIQVNWRDESKKNNKTVLDLIEKSIAILKKEIYSEEKIKWNIENFFVNKVEVIPQLFLYDVKDFIGNGRKIIGIDLFIEKDGELVPYATLTNSFGEFIGLKNTAYIDLNNCPYAMEFLKFGIARDTGYTKRSGHCSYPLWQFDADNLKSIGGQQYKLYSDNYDDYMSQFNAKGEYVL